MPESISAYDAYKLVFSIVADSKEDADGNAYVIVLKIVSQGSDLNGNMLGGWHASADTGIMNSGIANSRLPAASVQQLFILPAE